MSDDFKCVNCTENGTCNETFQHNLVLIEKSKQETLEAVIKKIEIRQTELVKDIRWREKKRTDYDSEVASKCLRAYDELEELKSILKDGKVK